VARHLLSWEAKRFAKIALVETRFDESAPGRLRKIRGADYLSLFPDFRLPDGLALGLWGAVEQWMQLRFIVRGSGHSAATIWASGTATLFVLFAAATGAALVSTRFGCLQPDCLLA
jgi:hypothetical protein